VADRVVARRRIVRLQTGGQGTRRVDHLAVEEPLEIRVDGQTRTTTMRTPGEDFELALGWCLADGVIDADDVATIRYCAGRDEQGRQTYNVVDVATRSGAARGSPRLVQTTSACGLCGSESIADVRKRAGDVHGDDTTVTADVLAELPDRLRQAQAVFERTGGLHAAGVFTPQGEVVCVREDVGRHNAVDKVLGWAVTEHAFPLAGRVLMVSGRVAFEIVAKALTGHVPIVAAVSAPTSLAAELADDAGVTLVGFLRGATMNVYTHPERVLA
jgi:FdhD protein